MPQPAQPKPPDKRLCPHSHPKSDLEVQLRLDDEDFFARKAIGWALRDYARTDAEWVRRLVDQHRGRLSPLSVREALKRLG